MATFSGVRTSFGRATCSGATTADDPALQPAGTPGTQAFQYHQRFGAEPRPGDHAVFGNRSYAPAAVTRASVRKPATSHRHAPLMVIAL